MTAFCCSSNNIFSFSRFFFATTTTSESSCASVSNSRFRIASFPFSTRTLRRTSVLYPTYLISISYKPSKTPVLFNSKLPSISVTAPAGVPTNRIVAPIKGSLESLSFTAPLILILAANAGSTHNRQKKATTENRIRNSFFIYLYSTFLITSAKVDGLYYKIETKKIQSIERVVAMLLHCNILYQFSIFTPIRRKSAPDGFWKTRKSNSGIMAST